VSKKNEKEAAIVAPQIDRSLLIRPSDQGNETEKDERSLDAGPTDYA
jgi:hypothetical protein